MFLISGDYRCFYLAWLKINTDERLSHLRDYSPKAEPKVPSGLDALTGALADFMDVFGIDEKNFYMMQIFKFRDCNRISCRSSLKIYVSFIRSF